MGLASPSITNSMFLDLFHQMSIFSSLNAPPMLITLTMPLELNTQSSMTDACQIWSRLPEPSVVIIQTQLSSSLTVLPLILVMTNFTCDVLSIFALLMQMVTSSTAHVATLLHHVELIPQPLLSHMLKDFKLRNIDRI